MPTLVSCPDDILVPIFADVFPGYTKGEAIRKWAIPLSQLHSRLKEVVLQAACQSMEVEVNFRRTRDRNHRLVEPQRVGIIRPLFERVRELKVSLRWNTRGELASSLSFESASWHFPNLRATSLRLDVHPRLSDLYDLFDLLKITSLSMQNYYLPSNLLPCFARLRRLNVQSFANFDSTCPALPQLEHLEILQAETQELGLISWKCPALTTLMAGRRVRFDRLHPLPSTLTYLTIQVDESGQLEEIGPLVSRLAGLKKLDIAAYPLLQTVWASFLALLPVSLDALAILARSTPDTAFLPISQNLARQRPIWLPNLRALSIKFGEAPSVEPSDLVRDLCSKRGIAFSMEWWQ